MTERQVSDTSLVAGVDRVTLPLPTGLATSTATSADGWTLVDTGLGLETPGRVAGSTVVRIVITHMHPDHVGGAEPAAAATGAPVYQGALDYAQCERVWGSHDWPERIADWFLRTASRRRSRRS